MSIKERSFIGGAMVIGFTFFLIGFLSGMLTVAFIPAKLDSSITLLIFMLGFVTGMVTIVLVLMALKIRELTR